MAKVKAVQQPNGIYTREHYQMLLAERRNLNDLISTLDKADSCGIDCTVYRQMRADIDNQLTQIQQHFMTPAPA